MSRSYKKTPILKQCGYGKYGKKMANKKVRQYKNMIFSKSKKYKKLFDQWNIKDFVSFYAREKAVKDGSVKEWEAHYRRK